MINKGGGSFRAWAQMPDSLSEQSYQLNHVILSNINNVLYLIYINNKDGSSGYFHEKLRLFKTDKNVKKEKKN